MLMQRASSVPLAQLRSLRRLLGDRHTATREHQYLQSQGTSRGPRLSACSACEAGSCRHATLPGIFTSPPPVSEQHGALSTPAAR